MLLKLPSKWTQQAAAAAAPQRAIRSRSCARSTRIQRCATLLLLLVLFTAAQVVVPSLISPEFVVVDRTSTDTLGTPLPTPPAPVENSRTATPRHCASREAVEEKCSLKASSCHVRAEGWNVLRGVALRDIGYYPAAVVLGQDILLLGGVTEPAATNSSTVNHLREVPVDVYEYMMQHTSRHLNLFHPSVGRVSELIEVSVNESSTVCPISAVGARRTHCIEEQVPPRVRQAQLAVPVVGAGSVVRVQNRAYAFGACNTIPRHIDVSLLRTPPPQAMQTAVPLSSPVTMEEERLEHPSASNVTSSSDSSQKASQTRVVDNYLRSVLRLQLLDTASPSSLSEGRGEADDDDRGARVLHQQVRHLPTSMTLRYNATCVAGARGTVYIIGGINARTGEALDSVALYDTASEAFVEGVWTLQDAVVTPAAAADNGFVFVAGGYSDSAHDLRSFPVPPYRDYHTAIAVMDTHRGTLSGNVARYALRSRAAALQWASPQLFVRGTKLFMLGSGDRTSYEGIAYWRDMTRTPAEAALTPLTRQHTELSCNVNLPGVRHFSKSTAEEKWDLSFADLSLQSARRDGVVVMAPSIPSRHSSPNEDRKDSDSEDDTVTFYLFGGRTPVTSSVGESGAAQPEVFTATLRLCSEMDSKIPVQPSPENGSVQASLRSPLPKLLGFSYTRLMSSESRSSMASRNEASVLTVLPDVSRNSLSISAAPRRNRGVPNNKGRRCVTVSHYDPLWYNISFSVLLSYTEALNACPGISSPLSNAHGSTPLPQLEGPSSTCSLRLSASPQCDEPIADFRHLGSANVRAVNVPVYDANGTRLGTQKALSVAQTLLIGSRRRGLAHVFASDGGAFTAGIGNDAHSVFETMRTVSRSRAVNRDGPLHYVQDYLYVCFSRGTDVIANCTSSESVSIRATATNATEDDAMSSSWRAEPHNSLQLGGADERLCQSAFYETLPPHTSWLLAPEQPCDTNTPDNGAEDDDSDGGTSPTPTPSLGPHRLLSSLMLLSILIVLAVVIVLYLLVAFVFMPGYAFHGLRGRGGGRDDGVGMGVEQHGRGEGIALDQQRPLLPYHEARIFLGEVGVGAFTTGAGAVAGTVRGSGALARSGAVAGDAFAYPDEDYPEEYETALSVAGVDVGFGGFDRGWDAAPSLARTGVHTRGTSLSEARGVRPRLLDGKYEVIRKLGKGSFSVVFLVRRITDDAIFALKYLQCSDDVDRHEAMKECELVYALQGHPNVIHLFDMFMSYRFDRQMITVPRTRRTREKATAKKQPIGGGTAAAAEGGDGDAPSPLSYEKQDTCRSDALTGEVPEAADVHSVSEATAALSTASRPVVHVDSAYLDAVASGVLADESSESPTTPPQQRQQAEERESDGRTDGTCLQRATALPQQQQREKKQSPLEPSSLQAERFLSLVMAFHECGDLARWVRQRRALQPQIPEATIVSIGFQVLSLLFYMHHRHQPPIIHRDLKPENILLASHVRYDNVNEDFLPLVVTDFGLSRVMDKTFCETGVGSLPYVAPECWQRRYSTKVDIWALGCVLYAVCSKRVDSNTVKVMFSECTVPNFHQKLKEEITQVYGYSEGLAWFIATLLIVNPDDRPTATEALRMLRRQPENSDGTPVFPGPPLATLLRPAPPSRQDSGVSGWSQTTAEGRAAATTVAPSAASSASVVVHLQHTRPAPLPVMAQDALTDQGSEIGWIDGCTTPQTPPEASADASANTAAAAHQSFMMVVEEERERDAVRHSTEEQTLVSPSSERETAVLAYCPLLQPESTPEGASLSPTSSPRLTRMASTRPPDSAPRWPEQVWQSGNWRDGESSDGTSSPVLAARVMDSRQ